jgi:hypothetical protein
VDRGGRALSVKLSFFMEGRNSFTPIGPDAHCAEHGISELWIQTKRNDWFINEELHDFEQILSSISAKYDVVDVIGSSMGAYGALLFADCLRATKVVAISPQFTVNPRIADFETRWRPHVEKIDFSYEKPLASGSRVQNGYILYDPRFRLDRLHAELALKALPQFKALKIPFGGHPATFTILSISGARPIFSAFNGDGEVSTSQILRIHRQARKESPFYIASLAQRVTKRHRKMAVGLMKKALDCDLARLPAPNLFFVGKVAAELGVPEGDELMSLAIDSLENPPDWWVRKRNALKAAKKASAPKRPPLDRRMRKGSAVYLANLAQRLTKRRRALALTVMNRALDRDLSDLAPPDLFVIGHAAAGLGIPDGDKLMSLAIDSHPNPPEWWAWKRNVLRSANSAASIPPERKASAPKVVRLRKEARRHSAFHMATLAYRAMKRRPAVALALARGALDCDLSGLTAPNLFFVGNVAAELGVSGGDELMSLAIDSLREPPAWWVWKRDTLRSANTAAAGRAV